MPDRPKRPCRKQNCGALTDNGYCDAHQSEAPRAQFDRNRESAWKRGYDAAWQRVRLMALQRDLWLCRDCRAKKLMVPAEEVHHIVPIAKAPELRLRLVNLMSLCKSCHSRRTAMEDSSFARPKS